MKVIHNFFFAQKAFILCNESLLLVQKSAEDPHNPGLWEVPGGRMDFGEDVDEHIRREITEEVGLLIDPGRPFFIWQWQLERKTGDDELTKIQIVAVARLCRALTRKIDTSGRVDEDYLGDVAWVPIARVKDYELIPNMLPVVTRFLEEVKRNSNYEET